MLRMCDSLLGAQSVDLDIVLKELQHKRPVRKNSYQQTTGSEHVPLDVGTYIYAKPPPHHRGYPYTCQSRALHWLLILYHSDPNWYCTGITSQQSTFATCFCTNCTLRASIGHSYASSCYDTNPQLCRLNYSEHIGCHTTGRRNHGHQFMSRRMCS